MIESMTPGENDQLVAELQRLLSDMGNDEVENDDLDDIIFTAMDCDSSCWAVVMEILYKAADDGSKAALLQLSNLYRWGVHKQGVYVDREKALQYCEKAGREYDDADDFEDYEPEYVAYTLCGDPATLDSIRNIVMTLDGQFGKPHDPRFAIEMDPRNELPHLVPLLPLMTELTGATDCYYFGYFMGLRTMDEHTLVIYTEIKHEEGLYYALKQNYSNLEVTKKEFDNQNIE